MRLAAALALLAACGTPPRPTDPRVAADVDDVSAGSPAPAVPRVPVSSLARAELLPVLDAGLPGFLKLLRVRRVVGAGGFVGWRLVWLDPARFAAVNLAPGDVVTAVNGRSVERPEGAHEIWESLRQAPALVVDYLRGGEKRTLTLPIVD